MRSLSLPNTDLTVSGLCLGAGGIGTSIPWDAAREMLDAFRAAGGNFLDTARVYADWVPGGRHASEKALGRWLRESGQRDQVVIATKGAHPELATMDVPRMSPAEIAADVDGSLADLGTDYIDLWYFHRDDLAQPVEEILEAIWVQTDAGKVRYIGCSNWTLPRIQAAQSYAAARGKPGFVANQPLWNAAVPNTNVFAGQGMVAMDDSMNAWHAETQVAAIPFSSQANGFFQKLAANGGDIEAIKGGAKAIYGSEENRQRGERIQRLVRETGLSITQITLGYLAAHPFPVSAIVGPNSVAQLTDTLTAADSVLTAEQAAFLEGRSDVL